MPESRRVRAGDSALDGGRWEEAARHFSDALKHNPDSAYCLRRRGWAWFELGDFESALVDAEAAVRLRPEEPHAFRLLGSAHSALGHFQAAADAQEKVAELEPHSRDGQLVLVARRVQAAYGAGNFHRVVELASEGIGLSNGFRITRLLPFLHRKRGWAYHRLKKHTQALRDSMAAVRLEGDDPDAHALQGHAYSALGQFREAAQAQERALQLDPEDEALQLALLLRRSDVAADAGDLQAAVELASQGLQQAEDTRTPELLPDFYRKRGWAHHRQGQHAQAAQDARAAAELAPEEADAFSLLERAQAAQRHFREAVEAQERVVQLDPQSRPHQLLLLLRRAQAALQGALPHPAPAPVPAPGPRPRLRPGEAAEAAHARPRGGAAPNPQSALDLASRGIRMAGDYSVPAHLPELYRVRGLAQAALGRFPEALEDAEAAERLEPGPSPSPGVLQLRSRALAGQRRRGEALSAAEAALGLAPQDWELQQEVLLRQADCALDAGRLQEGLASATEGLRLASAPDTACPLLLPHLYCMCSQAHAKLCDFPRALEEAQEALRLEPQNAACHCRLGDALLGLQRHQDAWEAYSQGLHLAPQDEELQTALAASSFLKAKAKAKHREAEAAKGPGTAASAAAPGQNCGSPAGVLSAGAAVGSGSRDGSAESGIMCTRYTMPQLSTCTDNFSERNRLGKGAFGAVYRGQLHGTTVAVKRLFVNNEEDSGFKSELEVLSRIRHPHIVLLMGHCPEGPCLVYEYLSGGNLQQRIGRAEGRPPLSWTDRFRIAAEMSTALLFLHSHNPPILHRDLKPENIMLDGSGLSKIVDVGLARLIPEEARTLRTRGTPGFMDPEEVRTLQLSVKSDVYALGLIVLLLFTALKSVRELHDVLEPYKTRRPLTGLGSGVPAPIREGHAESGSATVALPPNPLQDQAEAAILERLDKAAGAWPLDLAQRVVRLALRCADRERALRPDMAGEAQPQLVSVFEEALGRQRNQAQALFSETLSCTRYTMQQLSKSTDNFSRKNRLGKGAFGAVYRGQLHGTTVAVKRLFVNNEEESGFRTELEVLSRMRHPHIVLLMGHCPEGPCLVYEYLSGGNLQQRIGRAEGRLPLSFADRFRIAAEMSTALLFLHSHSPPILHRDLKPDNIMLDGSGLSKIGDVGLARLIPEEVVTMRLGGTGGFIDPEMLVTCQLTTASDVYAFGLILLQLFTGFAKITEVHQLISRDWQEGTPPPPYHAPMGPPHGPPTLPQPAPVGDCLPVVMAKLDQTAGPWPLALAERVVTVALMCAAPVRKLRPDLMEHIHPELTAVWEEVQQHHAQVLQPALGAMQPAPHALAREEGKDKSLQGSFGGGGAGGDSEEDKLEAAIALLTSMKPPTDLLVKAATVFCDAKRARAFCALPEVARLPWLQAEVASLEGSRSGLDRGPQGGGGW